MAGETETQTAAAAACSDAERRRAQALAQALRAGGRETRVTPHWVRPGWWAVQALCAGTGVTASVVGVDHPTVGLAVAGSALALAALDLTRRPLLRRLTPSRATQSVVSLAPERPGERPVTLVLTAAIDDPPAGTLLGRKLRLPAVLLAVLLMLCAALTVRVAASPGSWLDVVQLLPTLAALALVPLLLYEGLGDPQPSDSTRATVLELAEILDARPPRNLDVAVVFAGAAGALHAGLQSWLSDRRGRLDPAAIALVHVEPHAAEEPVWWQSDGIIVRSRLHRQLTGAARRAAAGHPGAHAVRSARPTAAAIARAERWPAIAVGPGSSFALALIGELDTELGTHEPQPVTAR